jgi:hypothetical protein
MTTLAPVSKSAGFVLAAALTLAIGCDANHVLGVADSGAAGAAGATSDSGSGDVTTDSGLGGGCAWTITFADGTTHGLVIGPHNHVFLDPTIDTAPTKNYATQTVFSGPTLALPADFAVAPSTIAPSPSSGTALDPWLGELMLLPAGCQPGSLVGRTVTVKLIWLLDGTLGNVPGHGLYLGTYANGSPVAYADAQVTTTRTLNTLAPITLTHQFTNATDGAEGIYFRAYLLGGDGETPTTIHVDSITWQ